MNSVKDSAGSFPILEHLQAELEKNGLVAGMNIGWHCHLTALTALTVDTLIASGATVFLSECNPDTSDKQAVDMMRSAGAKVYLGPTAPEQVLQHQPSILADTGLALIEQYISNAAGLAFAGSEITTSGITRLRRLQRLALPVVNINEGRLKHFIENFHGVGDGVVDALYRISGRMWAGRAVAVVGYGRVGAGVAHYLGRSGAQVAVVEKDSVLSLAAHYDGFAICDLSEALRSCQLVVTATGQENLVSIEQWKIAANGIHIVNVGHFASEIDRQSLVQMSDSIAAVNEHLEEFTLGVRKIYLATRGSPANVVMLSGSIEPTLIHLTTEMLTVEYLCQQLRRKAKLAAGEMAVPEQVELKASVLALKALGLAGGSK